MNPALLRPLATNAALIAGMAVLVFGAAGTLAWWQGWLFLLAYVAWAVGASIWLYHHDPALFARRLRGGPFAEKEPAQKIIMGLMSVLFVAALLVPALDHRFGWTRAPAWLGPAGDALFSLGWLVIMAVFRENSFTAATIEIMPGQAVIATGPYAIIRHPMYAGGFLLLAGIPIALGSLWGLLAVLAMLPGLIWRLLDEERLLLRDLPGYADYTATVRSRLLPGLW